MTPKTFDFTSFHPSHVPGAHRLSVSEKWPHRVEDWRLLASLSSGVAVLDGETVVATALASDFGPVAITGMILVDACHRGHGLGRRVMQAAMAELPPQKDREWRLIATQDGLPLYRKMGFAEYGRVSQHQGIVMPENQDMPLPEHADATKLDEIAALDQAGTGMDRYPLLQEIFRKGQVFLSHASGRVTGYAALRPFGLGEVLGPVIATSEDDAKALIAPILASVRGKFVRLDVPAEGGLPAWLTRQGLFRAGGGVCMRKGEATRTDRQLACHALAAQALG